ncbi:Dual specificity protein kinase shkD [Tetrabaena socialis]|uniref:Dual specificity protein kinase shkD n=1 Tax=Tetrabaena socialis TaxID=47790 RepID=A0A2J8A8K4_9CHLO|nr:Dual specificity protein kinase shkD [Tetrabaena socialis]|eukprot:PNH08793.1 Dual specificity protein kinase shkD [Tetrabaena socialis]
MELCESSLERLLYGKGRGLLPMDKLLHIAIEIARGLEYLHPTCLHRDLKPANVLLNGADTDRPVAKLTDFGLSRLRSTILLTQDPEAGTPAYTAPECFMPDNYEISHSTDVYALGVMLWEMLSGVAPWKAEATMVAIAYQVTVRGNRPAWSLVPDDRRLPKLARLIEQCWDHCPRRRPGAAEVVKQLALIPQAG